MYPELPLFLHWSSRFCFAIVTKQSTSLADSIYKINAIVAFFKFFLYLKFFMNIYFAILYRPYRGPYPCILLKILIFSYLKI